MHRSCFRVFRVFRGEKSGLGESCTWSLFALRRAVDYIPAIRVARGLLGRVTLSGASGRKKKPGFRTQGRASFRVSTIENLFCQREAGLLKPL